MKKNIRFVRHLGMLLMATFLLTVTFASCSSDDVVKTQLASPVVSEGSKTVSTLAFNWEPVSGATQYAYELYDTNDNVILGNVVSNTSILATGLTPNTTYTLKVWAYSPVDGDKSTSPIATLTATTNPVEQLSKPETPQATSANGGVTITWPEVEHATGYKYKYAVDGVEERGEVETNSVSLQNLPIGEYTIEITATSSDENYCDSDPITLTFQRTKAEVWRKTGTYTSAALNQTFTADIVAYDDGSYTIEAPFGEEGYSISFTKSSEGYNIIPTVEPDNYGYYYIPVSSQYYVGIYTDGNYSSFDGDKDKGNVWFSTYLYDNNDNYVGDWGCDEFSWSSDDVIVDEIPTGCKEEVPALMETTWGQYGPYYNNTPVKDGVHCYTGCIATALAQIVKFYQYPDKYEDGSAIDYTNMLDSYGEAGSYTDAQANAVAQLMAKCGEAVNMTYGAYGSYTYPSEVENGFAEKFGYKVLYYGYRDYPNTQDATKWKEVIFKELSAGHPILYGGTSYKNGYDNYFSHSFVIDGYDKQGRVHVNYGYDGRGDGYYPIDKLPMQFGGWDEEFDTYQTLVVIHRPQDGDISYDLQPQK